MPDLPPSVLEKYRSAVAAEPNNAQARCNLGWGYYGKQQYTEAVNTFREALAIDPDMVDAHHGLGLALKVSGGKQAAITAFESVAQLAPQLEDQVRGHMIARLAQGHISFINTGEWHLERDVRQHE